MTLRRRCDNSDEVAQSPAQLVQPPHDERVPGSQVQQSLGEAFLAATVEEQRRIVREVCSSVTLRSPAEACRAAFDSDDVVIVWRS